MKHYFLLFMLSVTGVYAADTVCAIKAVRLATYADKQNRTVTRFILEGTKPFQGTVFSLPNPSRVVIDFKPLIWQATALLPVSNSLIRSFRHGLFDAQTFRVVLDMSSPAQLIRHFTLPPKEKYQHRFVLDLLPTDDASFLTQSQKLLALRKRFQPPAKKETLKLIAKKTFTKDYKPIIVLDPGHGGIDPGAIGPGGTKEKRITLSVARLIAGQLRKTNRYRVYLTRDKDVFIPLRRRIAVGRRHKGDIFISIHADAAPRKSAQGASVYTLSERASDKEAALLASKENKSDLIAGLNLDDTPKDAANILIDLAQRDTKNASLQLTHYLLGSLKKEVPLLSQTGKSAGFAVLKAPDMPSILLEVGFLSNPSEEKRLRHQGYQQKIAKAIVRAINAYWQHKKN
jgi:N-acetylmuramoyl-L-alanine amidase